MSKKGHVQLWHKKQGKQAGASALARHGTVKGGKFDGVSRLTPAQAFFVNLTDAIRKGKGG
ncbi:MAG: hypothetical protein WCI27_04250 [Candidatus Omnitrophota bacterium]